MYAQIDVVGSPVDLHSGGFGGAVENPAIALAQIIAALKGPDGRVRVPGFYDDVVELTEAEHAAMAALPFDDEAFRVATGVPALVGEAGYSTLERRATRPTLDVNGIWGGFQGHGAKTIIPAHAHAKVSCRLVADQDPVVIFALFRAFVAAIAPPGVTVTRPGPRRRPAQPDADRPPGDPGRRACARDACSAARRCSPARAARSRSRPTSRRVLGLPVVLLGFAQPHDNAHAPNEWMLLDNYEGADPGHRGHLRRDRRAPALTPPRARRLARPRVVVRTCAVRVGDSGPFGCYPWRVAAPPRRTASGEERTA